MGVHGLWRLIEPAGKPIPLETLENKVLAVDISIWLHQTIKGFQDSKGAPLPNAHLLGIFHRVCKLLYYGIHPIFVFDGGVPVLKKQIIAKRNQLRLKNINDENILRKRLINNLLKYSAINVVIPEKTEANVGNNVQETEDKIQNDIFHLPDSQFESTVSSSEEEYTSDTEHSNPMATLDLHTIDEKSTHFKSLPADVRHEILTELKETRKQSSWGRIHELPKQSDDFAVYQMKRLLKRYSIQMSLEEAEKEMGGHTLSLGELEILLNDHGVITSKSVIENRILADENKRYFYFKNIKEVAQTSALKNAEDEDLSKQKILNNNSLQKESSLNKLEPDMEYENDLKEAIKLSLENEIETSNNKQAVDSTKVLEENENFNNDLNNITSDSQLSKGLLENKATTSKEMFSTNKEITSNESCGSNLNDVTSQHKSINKSLTSTKKNILEDNAITTTETSYLTDADANSTLNSNIDVLHKYPSTFTDEKPSLASKTMNYKEKDNFKAKDDKVSLQVFDTHDEQNNLNINKSKSNNSKKSHESSNVETDSDSEDDFLEVQIPSEYEYEEQTLKKKSDIDKQTLQITIEKCTELDDDLFSDIFQENQNFQSKPLESESIQEHNTQKSTNICIASDDKGKESEGKTTEALINNNTVIISEVTENNKGGSVLLDEILKPLNENNQLDTSKLEDLRNKLTNEADQLITEKSNKERLATNITEQMYYEVQELLQLFGLPYVIAPMEAEAQCAFLNQINLTDGTITDDSDIWLFGGKTVYKNFFNKNKHVLEFQAENIQNAFSLSRYEMILLALLVGSDYTTGVQGIGPVTAVEILAAFPPTKTELSINQVNLVSGLKEFRKWLTSRNTAKSARISLKNKLKNTELPPQFPSLQVVEAYLEPAVDASAEPFSWGKPDISNLVNFSKEKFGWNQKKSEEILNPVLKRMEETSIQRKITDYFKTKHKIEVDLISNKLSKRVKKAVTKMGEDDTNSHNSSDNTIETGTRNKQESKRKTKEKNDDVKLLKLTKNLSRKRVKEIKIELNEMLLREESSSKTENSSTCSTFFSRSTHTNEIIPQKQRDEADSLKRKLKAIETFRKSKQGPGFLKKRKKVIKKPKEDAELSENSDS